MLEKIPVNTKTDLSMKAVKITYFEVKYLTQFLLQRDGSFCVVCVVMCVKQLLNITIGSRKLHKCIKVRNFYKINFLNFETPDHKNILHL